MKLLSLLFLLLFLSENTIAQDYALRQLEESPRHHEWVQVQDGTRTNHNFVVYPEVSENALAVTFNPDNQALGSRE